jgi:hypothetical protein
LVVFGFGGIASANTTTFNFEDATSYNGEMSGLATYMTTKFGSNVTTSDLVWYGESALFGSDVAYLHGDNDGTFDFDPSGSGLPASFKITGVSYTWGVYNATSGIDFGLDVYDDAYNGGNWRDNVFTTDPGDYHTGSDSRTFNSSWEVTRLRIHDSGTYDVGIDDLTIVDNRTTSAVPEPTTMLLLGLGLLGVAGIRRFKK